MMRQLTLLVTLLLVVGVLGDTKYDPKYGRHNITMGQRRLYPQFPVDTLLFLDNPRVEGSWLPYPRVQSTDVCYPPKGSQPLRFTITAFNVTDVVPKGEGGYAFITQGGVGSGKLCLHLKTQRGNGYNFVINVWGYNI